MIEPTAGAPQVAHGVALGRWGTRLTGACALAVLSACGGHGQAPDDFERLGDMLDPLILTTQMQNMFVAVLPGAGGRKGSFYVNHRVPESQVPDLINPTSGRYEDSIIQDLIPTIENSILKGRVR